jgi:hypothetical protein
MDKCRRTSCGIHTYWYVKQLKADHFDALEAARGTIADQQIELVQLRSDYENISGLLIEAREQIAALEAAVKEKEVENG